MSQQLNNDASNASEEAGRENQNRENQPGRDENFAGGKPGENVDQQANDVTGSTEQLATGPDEKELDNPAIDEPSEEELDEKKNNARDAMNDDTYTPPAEELVNDEP